MWLVDFNAGKTQLVSFDQSNTLVLLMWKQMGLFLRKNHLLRCWVWLSLLNCIGALTLSLLLKLFPRKLPWALIRSMKFLSPEIAMYLYRSTILPCMKYFCHVWAGAPGLSLKRTPHMWLPHTKRTFYILRRIILNCTPWYHGVWWAWNWILARK